MISDESIALTNKIISAGNVCSVHPTEWDSALTALVINRKWRHTWVPFLLSLEYCFLVGFSAFNYTIKSQSDFIIVFFIWIALTSSYLMLFWLNWNCTRFVSVFNGVLFLNFLQSNSRFCIHILVHLILHVVSEVKFYFDEKFVNRIICYQM